MAARPIWSGFLKLSLVAVPVRAYTATDSGGEVHLNQLHEECKSRIEHKDAGTRVVIFRKGHVVFLRPAGSLLEMFVLDYSFQVRPHTEFEDLVPKVDVDPEALDAAKVLIEETAKKPFDLAAYKDRNT